MTSRLFAYNPEHIVVSGAEIVGDISIQTGTITDLSTLQWYMGPDEDAHPWGFVSPYIIPYSIGDSALGGIIAYILVEGDPGYDIGIQHGLVAMSTDISTGTSWGCYGTLISGADGTAIGAGLQNTYDICSGCTTDGIAARLCNDSTESGYNDWYLPSKDELYKLYLNKDLIGGFESVFYCCSSEINNNNIFTQYLGNGGWYTGTKSYNRNRVRAVRGF